MTQKTFLIKAVVLVSLISMLLSCFCACSEQDPYAEIHPVPLPEGVNLTALFLHHEGMAMEPYYILKTTEQGICLKMTDRSPLEFVQQDTKISPYIDGFDRVMEGEKAQLHTVNDSGLLQDIEGVISRYGALRWDGFDRSVSKGNALDSGDRYELYFELSDGSTVTVNAYNCYPAGFPELLIEIQDIFHAQMESAQ